MSNFTQKEYFVKLKDISLDVLETFPAHATNPEDLPVVLCLHGFPDNKHSFDKQLEAFTGAGYRVIAPGLPGYCPESVSPATPSKWQLGMQMAEFMDALDLNDVQLVAHDWGSYLAAELIYHMPERIQTATVMAFLPFDVIPTPPPYEEMMQYALRNWYNFMLRIDGYSDRALAVNDYELIEVLWRIWSPAWHFTDSELEQVKETFRKPNVAAAATNYYKELGKPQREGEPSLLDVCTSPNKVPMLYIAGELDGCINPASVKRVKDTIYTKGVTLKMVQTGHFPHREAPEEVSRLILEHWKN